MDKIFVVPKKGLIVRKKNLDKYKEEGELALPSRHVMRLLRVGDLIKAKPKKQSKKKEGN